MVFWNNYVLRYSAAHTRSRARRGKLNNNINLVALLDSYSSNILPPGSLQYHCTNTGHLFPMLSVNKTLPSLSV